MFNPVFNEKHLIKNLKTIKIYEIIKIKKKRKVQEHFPL